MRNDANQRRSLLISEVEEIKALVKNRDEINKEIRRLHRDSRKGRLSENLHLYDQMNSLLDLYDQGKTKAMANICLALFEVLNNGNHVDLNRSATGDLAAYIESGKRPLNMPKAFHLVKENGELIPIMRGHNIVIGAQQGVGKTTFMACVAAECLGNGDKMIIFTQEMSIVQIWIKIYLAHRHRFKGEIYQFDEVDKWIRQKHPVRYKDFVQFMQNSENLVKVIDAEEWPASKIAAEIESSADYFGGYPDWWAVDYIQITEAENHLRKFSNIREQMIYKSRLFKNKSKRTNTVGLIFSQLNKENEFRESASMKDDAGMAFILSREVGPMGETMTLKMVKSRFTACKTSTVKFHGSSGLIGLPYWEEGQGGRYGG